MTYLLIFIAYVAIVTALGWYFRPKKWKTGYYIAKYDPQRSAKLRSKRQEKLRKVFENDSWFDNYDLTSMVQERANQFIGPMIMSIEVQKDDYQCMTFSGQELWIKNEHSDLSDISKPIRKPEQWIKYISSTCRHQCLPENSKPPYQWEELMIPIVEPDGTWRLEHTGKARPYREDENN